MKLLLSLWTDHTRSRGTLHDLEPHLHLIDDRIAQIQVPTGIKRKPRGIEDLKKWKHIAMYRIHGLLE